MFKGADTLGGMMGDSFDELDREVGKIRSVFEQWPFRQFRLVNQKLLLY
jgi:hypothetical protein